MAGELNCAAGVCTASKRLMLVLTLLAATLPLGETLPPLKGEFLTGRQAILPDASQGKVALLALGFSYDSRTAVEAYVKRFREEFGSEPRVTFFEVPMIGGMARMGKWFIDSGMRKGTPKADHEHVITVYGGVDPWKKSLGVTDTKHAYLILIDEKGVTRMIHGGGFDEAAYRVVAAKTRVLLAK